MKKTKSKSLLMLLGVVLLVALAYIASTLSRVPSQEAAATSAVAPDISLISLQWSHNATGPYHNNPITPNTTVYFRVGIRNIGGSPIILPKGYTVTSYSYGHPQGFINGSYSTQSQSILEVGKNRYFTVRINGGFDIETTGSVIAQRLPQEVQAVPSIPWNNNKFYLIYTQ